MNRSATPAFARIARGDVLRIAAGAAALLIFTFVLLRFRQTQSPISQLALKANRVDLVGQMQVDLASAAEAEKSAVLAITDQDSQTFSDQARAASAKVEQERRELEELETTGGTRGERQSLAQFDTAFTEFRQVDDELLTLAVQNSNTKAYALAYGPAAASATETTDALARLVVDHADSPDARAMMRLALGAEISVLRLQTLLPPHIAEESDRRMDEMEGRMAAEDARVHENLEALSALFKSDKLGGDLELAKAQSAYATFGQIRTQIIALSRENTNVRSLSLSLNQKRKVMLACQAALIALQQGILAEPIAGTTYGMPARPR
ncbi:MAG TPA: MCP four helix bundle domain-containing protein [Polyangiaceae bacterium]|jgi:hypothetical protein|nr:MCP four helix bundle domain-containing protein [Polyangiaceae bacterium]